MADNKNVQAPKVPAAPKAPAAPPAPVAPPAPPVSAEKPKKERKEWTYYFDTAEAAKAEADKRDGGPRKPFVMTMGDKTVYVVAHNPEHASKLAWEKLGGKYEEFGKESKSKKPVDATAIVSALSALKPEEQNLVLAELKKVLGQS